MVETYNKIYETDQEYKKHYTHSRYYPIWEFLAGFINKDDLILEIGCGTGQFAHMLKDLGITNYRGFDFSEKAVEVAKQNCDQSFFVGDAYKEESYQYPFNTLVATEVLEHLLRDIDLLSNLSELIRAHKQEGVKLLFSLPTFLCTGHYRCFPTKQSIVDRYGTLIDFKIIDRYRNWFYGEGVFR